MSSLEESLLESFLPGEVEQLAIDVVHHLPDPVSVQLKFSNFKIWTVGSFEVFFSLFWGGSCGVVCSTNILKGFLFFGEC